MPHEWIVPTVLTCLAVSLLIIWIPVWRENRKKKS